MRPPVGLMLSNRQQLRGWQSGQELRQCANRACSTSFTHPLGRQKCPSSVHVLAATDCVFKRVPPPGLL